MTVKTRREAVPEHSNFISRDIVTPLPQHYKNIFIEIFSINYMQIFYVINFPTECTLRKYYGMGRKM